MNISWRISPPGGTTTNSVSSQSGASSSLLRGDSGFHKTTDVLVRSEKLLVAHAPTLTEGGDPRGFWGRYSSSSS